MTKKDQIARELAKIVGEDGVVIDPDELRVYETDGLTVFKAKPDIVVLPDLAEQVARVVRVCCREKIPFVARGAGTGLSGGAHPLDGGVLIGLNRLNRIVEIDTENQRAVVEPGMVNVWLTNALSPRGYYYSPDPASQTACSIGGNVAENSGGPRTPKYGVTTNHVLGLEVVLPNGEFVQLGGRTLDTPGYDLTGVFVGSEGTFGIVTKVTARIMRKPEAVKTLMCVFESVEEASNTVSEIVARGIIPAAVELVGRVLDKDGHDVLAWWRHCRVNRRGDHNVQVWAPGEAPVFGVVVGAFEVFDGGADRDKPAQVWAIGGQAGEMWQLAQREIDLA